MGANVLIRRGGLEWGEVKPYGSTGSPITLKPLNL